MSNWNKSYLIINNSAVNLTLIFKELKCSHQSLPLTICCTAKYWKNIWERKSLNRKGELQLCISFEESSLNFRVKVDYKWDFFERN